MKINKFILKSSLLLLVMLSASVCFLYKKTGLVYYDKEGLLYGFPMNYYYEYSLGNNGEEKIQGWLIKGIILDLLFYVFIVLLLGFAYSRIVNRVLR